MFEDHACDLMAYLVIMGFHLTVKILLLPPINNEADDCDGFNWFMFSLCINKCSYVESYFFYFFLVLFCFLVD